RRGASRRVPARRRERRLVSARGEQAAATLVRLGLDPEAVRAGRIGAEAVAPLLAGADGAALAAALGELASAEVAALLLALEPRAGERAVRKELRRALYRLRQRGVPVPAPPAPAAAARTPAAPEAEGFLSPFDGRGDRLIWIVRPLPSGGSFLVAAQLNEPEGLRDVSAGEASRKQIRAARQKLEADSNLRLVAADWRTLDALLVEAHARAGGGTVGERDYLRLRSRLTSEPPRPPAAPGSTRVTAPSAAARAPPTRWRSRWWRRWSSVPWAASSPRRRPARRRSAAARSSSRPASSSEIERHPVAGALQGELVQVGERLAAQVREDEPPAAQIACARGDLRVGDVDADPRLVGRALAQEEVRAARVGHEVLGPRRVARVEDRASLGLDAVAEGAQLARVRHGEGQNAHPVQREARAPHDLLVAHGEGERLGGV